MLKQLQRKPRGQRVTSVARERELKRLIRSIHSACRASGFRIEAAGDAVGPKLAIFDDRESRHGWPVAAFADSIGPRIKGLDLQTIKPAGF